LVASLTADPGFFGVLFADEFLGAAPPDSGSVLQLSVPKTPRIQAIPTLVSPVIGPPNHLFPRDKGNIGNARKKFSEFI
jgi:hypothetical protein